MEPHSISIEEKLILETQQFEEEYKAWKKIPETESSLWPSFAKFWETAYDIWKETSNSAAKLGFGSVANSAAGTLAGGASN